MCEPTHQGIKMHGNFGPPADDGCAGEIAIPGETTNILVFVIIIIVIIISVISILFDLEVVRSRAKR